MLNCHVYWWKINMISNVSFCIRYLCSWNLVSYLPYCLSFCLTSNLLWVVDKKWASHLTQDNTKFSRSVYYSVIVQVELGLYIIVFQLVQILPPTKNCAKIHLNWQVFLYNVLPKYLMTFLDMVPDSALTVLVIIVARSWKLDCLPRCLWNVLVVVFY